jgi:predicted Fe-Mo cluster-binding NifX family protein
MRLGVTLEDGLGLESNVSAHFGQCPFFLIAEIKEGKVVESKVVKNEAEHGGGGCVAVDEILKHKLTHVIAGGMGMNAQHKFAAAGVKVFGYSGKVSAAIKDFLENRIGGLEGCKEHGNGDCH